MIRRLLRWLLTLAICFDQFCQVLIRGPKYVLFNGPRPSADETISDWVGQCADAKIKAGILAQALIDRIFGDGHCQQAIADDDKD